MINTKPLFDYDLSLLSATTQNIAGIDEVGRGPLAGPVVTACVIMPYAEMIDGVYDSKKVSKKNREKLYDIILSKAKAVSISIRNQDRIDEINILNATIECMKESVSKLTIKPDILLIDAVKLGIYPREMSIIKGDATSYAIACASIVAKVYRDRMMEDYAKVFPYYDFENNVGYGTKKHIEAIKTYGITPIHRLSFLKNIIGEEECKRIHTERVAK